MHSERSCMYARKERRAKLHILQTTEILCPCEKGLPKSNAGVNVPYKPESIQEMYQEPLHFATPSNI